MRGARAERPQVRKALRRPEVVGNGHRVRATRQLKSRALASNSVRIPAGGTARISVRGEVKGRGTAQATAVQVEANRGTGVGLAGGRRHMGLDDLDLSRVGITNRAVLQAHVVGQDVNLAAFLGADARGEDEDLPAFIPAEQGKLGVVLQGDGVIQV